MFSQAVLWTLFGSFVWTSQTLIRRDCQGGKSVDNSCSESVRKPSGTRWYYNKEKNECMAFKFKGCGERNVFESKKRCDETCLPLDGTTCFGNDETTLTIEDPEKQCNFGKNRLECPLGFVCRDGAFHGYCCSITNEKLYEDAYSEKCPNSQKAFRLDIFEFKGSFFGDSCDDLDCPTGFECLQINKLFAKCCETIANPVEVEEKKNESSKTTTEASTDAKNCSDPNKEFNFCGSPCPKSCGPISNQSCPFDCLPGCFCTAPYVLLDSSNKSSECVLPENCPGFDKDARKTEGSKKIAQNFTDGKCKDPMKEFDSCGLPCPDGCGMDSTQPCESLSCSPGCYCNLPYILVDPNDKDSRCVRPEDCPAVTAQPFSISCDDPLKEFLVCGPNCPPACGMEDTDCPPDCVSSCFCKDPYVLSDYLNRSSTCVLPDRCPKLEKPSEQKTTLPATTTTPTTAGKNINEELQCSDPNKVFDSCASPCPKGCNAKSECDGGCVPGCFCKEPMILLDANDPDSDCVLPTTCPFTPATSGRLQCKSNEYIDMCGPPDECELTCENMSDPPNCNFCLGVPKCSCNSGYFRDKSSGFCVTAPNCPGVRLRNLAHMKQICIHPIKEYKSCGPSCPPGCGLRGSKPCELRCVPGCYCKEGYILEDWTDPQSACITSCPEASLVFGTHGMPGVEDDVKSPFNDNINIPNTNARRPTPTPKLPQTHTLALAEKRDSGKTTGFQENTTPSPISPNFREFGSFINFTFTGPPTPLWPGPCVEAHVDCGYWAKKGICEKNPGHMYLNCQQSCNCCGCTLGDLYNNQFENKCEDRVPYCKTWYEKDQCNWNREFMEIFCRRSCGIC